jgi:hypothetical protein
MLNRSCDPCFNGGKKGQTVFEGWAALVVEDVITMTRKSCVTCSTAESWIPARNSELCLYQYAETSQRRSLCIHEVTDEAAELASEGLKNVAYESTGMLVKVEPLILTRNRSLWGNSSWPLRNKGQGFCHVVLKRNSYQVEE